MSKGLGAIFSTGAMCHNAKNLQFVNIAILPLIILQGKRHMLEKCEEYSRVCLETQA